VHFELCDKLLRKPLMESLSSLFSIKADSP
jgi:hypothetical protein